jgi:hypothetical protein
MRHCCISLIIALGLFIWMPAFELAAQEIPILINTEARLENVLMLKIAPDMRVEFGIKKVNENLYQITKQPDDVMFSVESTGNWDLSISADNSQFTGINDSTNKIPVDFLGLYVENTGSNWDNGLFSNMANITKDTVVYLSPERTKLLESGVRGNVGSSENNSFILRWKFFFEDEVLKLRRFSDYNIEDDNYTVGFYITLSESTVHTKVNQ